MSIFEGDIELLAILHILYTIKIFTGQREISRRIANFRRALISHDRIAVNQSLGGPSHEFLVTGSSKFSAVGINVAIPSLPRLRCPSLRTTRGSHCLPLLSSSRARPLAPRRYVEGSENAATW